MHGHLCLIAVTVTAVVCVFPGVATLRGTLPWIAPEIIKTPGTCTEAVDVYSFGERTKNIGALFLVCCLQYPLDAMMWY